MRDIVVPRIFVIVLCAVVFVAVLVVNGFAGAGRGSFHSSTGNVSARYETDITPAGWTFSIWGVIYTWLSLMVIYITLYVFRGSWAHCLLPYAFYFFWLFNMVLNMIWLLLWDRELMLSALVLLILIVISNYSALSICCFATDYYGLWLKTYYPKDLTCITVLVQNGLALYATWTSIASLINFTLVLQLWGVVRSTAATVSLCLLFAELVGWFILENWVLDRWVRNILTVYPVVIVALFGNVFKHFDPAGPSPNVIFTVNLLVLTCILLVFRVCNVIWRNRRRPLFAPGSTRLLISPLDGSKFKILS
ncbi:uncharacterized protein si:dkey-29d8.3 isoform X1 [Phyllopteryx taeniolatus]|uniref:uncharacterized protein si:dkey-29d8.3 isoform X1 n=1 Tax=Phyllopteryx taeniolatus TaxID=161469 RepID=UPI002AD4F6E3|nr:uncharacterized protein si:dkey-29d8.3 isoform X1 [Phyllopteryx taeniolatus]